MTPEQEAIAEKIIQLHKDNDAYLDWTVLYYGEGKSLMPSNLSDRKQYELLELIKSRLAELELIDIINDTGDKTRLREGGFLFKSFADKRQQEAKKHREERIKSFPQRYWWLVGLVAYFGGWGTELMRNKYLSKTKQDTTQSIQATPVRVDTNLNHRNPFSFDTFDKTKLYDTGSKGLR